MIDSVTAFLFAVFALNRKFSVRVVMHYVLEDLKSIMQFL